MSDDWGYRNEESVAKELGKPVLLVLALSFLAWLMAGLCLALPLWFAMQPVKKKPSPPASSAPASSAPSEPRLK